MMERGDVTVLHEPLVTLLDDGEVSIPDGPVLRSVAAVVRYATSLPGPVFVKDTTEHRYTDVLTRELAAGITHTFVIREPSAAIASHVAVKPDASCSDIGYENQWLLFEQDASGLTATCEAIAADGSRITNVWVIPVASSRVRTSV